MITAIGTPRGMVMAFAVGTVLVASVARGDEEKILRPEIEQLAQSVSERLQAAADDLDLTKEQRTEIGEIHKKHAQQNEALRAKRRALLQEELKAVGSILTAEQRDKMKEFAEDRVNLDERPVPPGLPRFLVARATFAERAQTAAEKLGLTSAQHKQIKEALAGYSEQHQALRTECRNAVEEEFKAIADVLKPEQREKARDAIELRVLKAAAAVSVADRLEAAADKLGMSAAQRRQVVETHAPFAGKYRALRSERRELLEEELNQIAAILTPEQREKVKDFCEDIVVAEGTNTGSAAGKGDSTLRESVAERLEAVADKLGLTAEQRTKIRAVRDSLADKFKAQRDQRKALRTEEFQALASILTPEQRNKVNDYVEERN